MQGDLENGWIWPSIFQYNYPILFIPKRNKKLRVYIDYRSLNNNTTIYKYPIPYIDDILDILGHAKKL